MAGRGIGKKRCIDKLLCRMSGDNLMIGSICNDCGFFWMCFSSPFSLGRVFIFGVCVCDRRRHILLSFWKFDDQSWQTAVVTTGCYVGPGGVAVPPKELT